MATNWQPVGEAQPLARAKSYDTELSPDQEGEYRQWMERIGHTRKAGYRVDDEFNGADYDYRGFYKKNGAVEVGKGQHFTDEFKKPAHETFSNESQYAVGDDAARAGRWEGETYQPPAAAPASRWQPVGQPKPRADGEFFIAGRGRSRPELSSLRPPVEDQPGVISSLARGIGERVGALGGGMAITAGKVGDFVARTGVPVGPSGLASMAGEVADRLRGVDTDAPRPGMAPLPDFVKEQIGKGSELFQGVGGEMTREGRLGYKPMTTTEDIKGDWREQKYLSATGEAVKFGLEQGIVSLPDMAAVLVNFPAYLASRSGEIAQERARVDGRDQVTDEDMAIGTATAAISSAMERYGAERVLGQIKGASKTVLRRILGASIAEATTEAGQEGAEYVGERIGQQPMSVAEGAERAGFGALGGGVGGGAIRSGVEVVDAVRGKRQDPASPPASPRDPSAGRKPATAAAAPAGPATAPAAAEPGVERYQMQRQRGELLGRQYEVRPLSEETFQYLLKPSLPKGHANTLDEYLQKHPTVTHVRVERSPGQKDWRLSKAGSADAIRPNSAVARSVDDFESPQAKQWAALDGEKSQRDDPDRLDVENDSILTAIAKLGGVSREEAEQNGVDPANFSHRGHRISLTFRKGGLSLDQMAEALNEFGYKVQNEKGDYDPNVLLDLIDGELGGKRSRSNQSGLSDEIARLEEQGRTAQAPATPVNLEDLLTHYADHPGSIEDETEVGTLHEPSFYPPEFDTGAKKLADLAEMAQLIDPTQVEAALQAGSDVEAARRLWSIINGEEVDAEVSDDAEVTELDDGIGEVAAADVQAGQEQPQQGAAVPESTDEEVDDEVAVGGALMPRSEYNELAYDAKPRREPAAARPDKPASSPLHPPQDDEVGATTPGGRSTREPAVTQVAFPDRSTARSLDLKAVLNAMDTGEGSPELMERIGDAASRFANKDLQASGMPKDLIGRFETSVVELSPSVVRDGKPFAVRVDVENFGFPYGEYKTKAEAEAAAELVRQQGHDVALKGYQARQRAGEQKRIAAIDAAAHEAATSEKNDKPLPTEDQREKGNYEKGHIPPHLMHGMNVSVENPKGSFRTNYSRKSVEALLKKQVGKQARAQLQASLKSYDEGDVLNAVTQLRAAASIAKEGLDGTGQAKALSKSTWVAKMPVHYGYIRGTVGADGEQLDVFIGDHAQEDGPVWVVDQATVDGKSYDESKAFIGFYDAAEATRAYVGSFEGNFGDKMLRQALGWREFPNVAAFKEWMDSADLTKPAVEAKPKRQKPATDEDREKIARERMEVVEAGGPEDTFFSKGTHRVKFDDSIVGEFSMKDGRAVGINIDTSPRLRDALTANIHAWASAQAEATPKREEPKPDADQAVWDEMMFRKADNPAEDGYTHTVQYDGRSVATFTLKDGVASNIEVRVPSNYLRGVLTEGIKRLASQVDPTLRDSDVDDFNHEPTPEELEKWWDKELTHAGRQQMLDAAKLKLPNKVAWRYLSDLNRTKLDTARIRAYLKDTPPEKLTRPAGLPLDADILDRETSKVDREKANRRRYNAVISSNEGGFLSVDADGDTPQQARDNAAELLLREEAKRGKPKPAESAHVRDLPKDNHRGPLSRYAPILYRETNLEGLDLLVGRTTTDMGSDRLYFADTPEMALGQGSNKGVMVEFDAAGIEGTINLSKPGLAESFRQGMGEYIGNHNHQPVYRKAVRKFTVKPGAGGDKVMKARMKLVFADLEQQGWERSSDEDGSYSYTRGGEAAPADDVVTPSVQGDDAGVTPEKSKRLAEWVVGRLKNRGAFTWDELFKMGNFVFAGTQAQGKYTPKDAYDAVELGVNLYLRSIGLKPSSASPENQIASLERMLELIPTQTKRTEEQDEFQQFSTPPHYSYVASWVANIRAGEEVLEPSAGIGGLAVFARNADAHVTANELSPRRAALLKLMGFDAVYTENAEQLNNVLPASVKPTLILANPPFSATAGRQQGKRSTSVGAKHVEQMLKRLEPKGRLVVIVGEGMADDRAAFKDWWREIKAQYNVRANVGIDGAGYRKYGTTFDNQLIVIDKDGPTMGTVVTGKVKNVVELIPLLEGIRNDRPRTGEKGKSAAAPSIESGSRPDPAARVEKPVSAAGNQLDAVGFAGGRGADRSAIGGPAGTRDAGELRQPLGAVKPTAGDVATNVAPEGRRQPAGGQRAEARDIAAGGGAAPAGSAARSDGSDSRVGFEQTETHAGALTDSIFEQYTPQRVKIPGAKAHPGKLVQSSAMASVLPPAATYTPKLPQEVISKGLLSDAQLETVIYAGQMHAQVMENGVRKGYFIGDGTGVGKGREISGIILDNMRQGRTKAIWVSEKQGLLKDAQRDFAGVGADPSKIFWQGNAKAAESIGPKDGVLFSTYATLRSAEKKTAEGQTPKTRLQQIVEWAGPDYDGVIAFDEAHNAGNAVTMKGKRGTAEPSRQALAVVELQKLLPKARVVYVSATGATELHNLSYATRLGLWGEGTPFPDVSSFINQVSQGGLAAMELVARDMKQMGVYTARSLSFDGVTYSRVQHNLTEIQREIYDELALAWQDVLGRVHEALEKTGGADNRFAKSAAMSAFWGSHQRFFNQVITSMQMPSVLDSIEQRMAAGEAIVLQLVNTNEAIQERKLATMGESEDIDDLDMTPRENLLQYIKNSFPVVQYEEFTDDSGNVQTRPAVDSKGDVVLNKEAVAARDALLEKLNQIRVPEGPLEMIINQFGTKAVAEVTGRRRRVVRDAQGKNIVETRGRMAAQADAEQFLADKKRIMIFSDAGGTGYSFHADLTKKNQRKRAHYLVQPGWRANKAVQGFGRTHRTNQANEPEYILVSTDLAAQKRFISSIARRLDQLGALTKGQRDTANQGMFSASDNLESEYAEDAVLLLFHDMYAKRIKDLDFEKVTNEMGLDLRDSEGQFSEAKIPEVPKFLNRLLSLTRDRQEAVFGAFNERMEDLVAAAIAAGTFDAGMETLPALSVDVKREEVVHTDEKSGAQTKYVQLELTRERHVRRFPTEDVDAKGEVSLSYYRNKKSGRVWVTRKAGQKTSKKGAVEPRYRMISPASERAGTAGELGIGGSNFEELTREAAQALWDTENDALGPTYTMPAHLITGAILPIWDRFEGSIRVVRTQSADGRRYLGRLVHEEDLEDTLKRLNVDSSFTKMQPAEVVKNIEQGNVVSLANGWRIFRATVSNEKRIEVHPRVSYVSESLRVELRNAGVFVEKINWRERFFIPTDMAADVLAKITKTRPVVDIKDIEQSDVSPSVASHVSAETAAKQAEFREQVDLKRVRERYERIASRWKGMKGRVIVRMNEFDIPWKYAANFFDDGRVGRVQGFLAHDTGDIYLLPGNWTSMEDGEEILFHEAEGHLSVAQFFGAEIVPYLNRVFMVDPAGVKAVGYEYGFYDKDGKPTEKVNFSHRNARLRSADEYIARMAQTVNSNSPRGMRRMWEWLVSHWAEMMRKAGWRSYKPTEAEIRGFLTRAQASLAKGKRDKFELSVKARARAAARTAEKLSNIGPQQQLGLHPSWNSPEPTKIDSFIQALQDRHIDTRRVQEAIAAASTSGVIAEDTNVYLQEELYHGRVAKRVQDFLDDEMKPLLVEMQKRHIDTYELNRYLHARHARERNEQIASINPGMPDGGSGMTNDEADTYLNGLSANERAELRALAAMVDDMIARSRELLVSYGLESPATIDIWQQTYANYVPLNREHMDSGTPGTGQGYSVRGPASKRAMGSEREVSNILASIAQQREKYLVRGEKNRIANALVGLALENPNPGFWKVDEPPMIRYVSPVSGLVEVMVDPTYKSHENAVVARVPDNKGNVREHTVFFNEENERALRMAKALKNLDSDQLGIVLGAFAKVTRYFASINTQYNPIFGIVNVYRDVQEGLLNLTSTPLAGNQAQIARLVVPALRGIYIETRERRSGNRRRSRWADLWEEFQAEGGQTGYRDMFNTAQERADALAKEIKHMTSKNPAGIAGRAVLNWLSDYNVAMENAVRVATYKVGIDAGLSKQQAASIAKNLTVNFNRKGAWGTQAGALYAFFNASVQGTARIVETLNSPAGKKIIAGGILVGVIQALMMAAAGFDEEDIPEFIQSNNLIIPLPGTDRKYLSLPYPLGFRFLPNIGRIGTQYVMSGFKETPRRVKDVILTLLDNFNPIGGSGTFSQILSPTLADPIVALGQNEDWTGQPIAMEDRDTLSPTPGHTRTKSTASAFSMVVSRVLNAATGGTDYAPGIWSPTPDQIDYLIGQGTGGVGRETLKTSQTVQSLYTGEALPAYKIPLFGRLYGTAADQAGESRTFYNNVKKMNQLRNEIMGRAEDELDFDAYVEDPLAGMALDVNRVEKLVSDLRREKRRLQKTDAGREDIKEIDTQITEAMAEINRQVAEMEKGR